MIRKIRNSILFSLSFILSSLGIVGFFGLCCTVVGSAVLAFLGLAFLSFFLTVYSKWFLLAGFIFLVLALLFLKKK